MDISSESWLIMIVCLLFFAACWAVIAYVFVTLARQGDERRRMIVEKASANTFAVMMVYLLICILERVAGPMLGWQPGGVNPFVMLLVMSVVYAVELVFLKRKYGD